MHFALLSLFISACNWIHRGKHGFVTLLMCAFLTIASTVTGVYGAEVHLTWEDNSNDERGFTVERSVGDKAFVEIAILPANSVRYIDTSATEGEVYSYRLRAFNEAGYSEYSNIATNVAAVTRQPVAFHSVPAGGDVTLSVLASGAPPPTLQWQVSTDGGVTWTDLSESSIFSGVTTATLTISNVPAEFHDHRFRIIAKNVLGIDVSRSARLTIDAKPRLANLSIRTRASANNTLIVGFVISGATAKETMVRAVGPTLAAFGIERPLDLPILSLYRGTQFLDSNEGWSSAFNAELIAATSSRLGAFSLPQNSRDAVLLTELGNGTNTAQLTAPEGSDGIALFELYDCDPLSSGKLINISARTHVGTEVNAPIVGFVISGQFPAKLLIRAIGPTLQSFGVSGVLSDPQLVLYRDGASQPLHANDNWGGAAALKSAFSSVGAFALSDSSRDAALSLTLEPGSYTVHITGTGNITGIALIELYLEP